MKQFLLPEDGKFYKVNMHSHTTLSDGKCTPEEVKEHYKAAGYAAVAFSEHEALYDLSRLDDEDFIAITSYEMSINRARHPAGELYDTTPKLFDHMETVHMNLYALDQHNTNMVCYNPRYVFANAKNDLDNLHYVGKPDSIREYNVDWFNYFIRKANENGFLVSYNHPNWSMNTYDVYGHLKGLTAMEINNGGANVASEQDYAPRVYEEMIRSGQRIGVVAGDDNHGVPGERRAWTMVKANALTYDELLSNIKNGNCYASDGPEIYDLFVENGAVTVRCSEAASIHLTTVYRRKACRYANAEKPALTEATFPLFPTDCGFRVTVRGKDGKHANTRVYFFDELNEPIPEPVKK